MLAFTNTTHTKEQVLTQIRAHAAADEIVKGQYWQNGKGCAVGCTLHSDSHAEYESRFGIPQMLAHLEDRIFEGLPNGTAKAWPERFMNAVKPGTDLSKVGWKFLHWLLTDETVNPGISHSLVQDAVKKCVDVLLPLTKGEKVDSSAAWSAAGAAGAASDARSAAWSAAWSAASAASVAKSAAWSAASAASAASDASDAWSDASDARSAASAASDARSAAWSAAWSAASAASAARSAARSAASAARSAAWSAAWSAAGAASDAWSAAYTKMSNKLVELIEAA